MALHRDVILYTPGKAVHACTWLALDALLKIIINVILNLYVHIHVILY